MAYPTSLLVPGITLQLSQPAKTFPYYFLEDGSSLGGEIVDPIYTKLWLHSLVYDYISHHISPRLSPSRMPPRSINNWDERYPELFRWLSALKVQVEVRRKRSEHDLTDPAESYKLYSVKSTVPYISL